jgi:hypothetical protein
MINNSYYPLKLTVMKTIMKLLILSFFITSVTSCMIGTPVASFTPENNKTYYVHYLFEHDGCKVYRFQDYRNEVYFTNCTGDVTSIQKDSTEVRVINTVKVLPE